MGERPPICEARAAVYRFQIRRKILAVSAHITSIWRASSAAATAIATATQAETPSSHTRDRLLCNAARASPVQNGHTVSATNEERYLSLRTGFRLSAASALPTHSAGFLLQTRLNGVLCPLIFGIWVGGPIECCANEVCVRSESCCIRSSSRGALKPRQGFSWFCLCQCVSRAPGTRERFLCNMEHWRTFTNIISFERLCLPTRAVLLPALTPGPRVASAHRLYARWHSVY